MAITDIPAGLIEEHRLSELNREYGKKVSDLYVQNFRDYLNKHAQTAIDEACEQLRGQMKTRISSAYDMIYGEQRFNVEISFKGKPDVGMGHRD